MTGRRSNLCRLSCKSVQAEVALEAVTEAFSRRRGCVVLGGNCAKEGADGFSYWAAEPSEIFVLRHGEEAGLERLGAVLGKYRLAPGQRQKLPAGAFCGGWVGYLGYELGRYTEPAAFARSGRSRDDVGLAVARLCFYDRFICYDHRTGRFWLVALDWEDRETASQKLEQMERLLEQAQRLQPPEPREARIEQVRWDAVRCNMDKQTYLQKVGTIKRAIFDGEVYQINFSQRFERRWSGRAIDLYHWQNRFNPSGYSAYIDGGEFFVVSASPELFLRVEDGWIWTKPIKGTRRRVVEAEGARAAEQINARNYQELLDSEKDKAELYMIIDLERNDLARVCEPGTRTVVQDRTIETCATVYHAVATIAGRLRDDVGFCDILRATFPGGSITGAPKVRAMQLIDELEPTGRGVYTGSIGYIGIDGNACLNIAIRTIIIARGRGYVQAGGGIVADSEPEAEWCETITKARALLAGMEAVAEAPAAAVRNW